MEDTSFFFEFHEKINLVFYAIKTLKSWKLPLIKKILCKKRDPECHVYRKIQELFSPQDLA